MQVEKLQKETVVQTSYCLPVESWSDFLFWVWCTKISFLKGSKIKLLSTWLTLLSWSWKLEIEFTCLSRQVWISDDAYNDNTLRIPPHPAVSMIFRLLCDWFVTSPAVIGCTLILYKVQKSVILMCWLRTVTSTRVHLCPSPKTKGADMSENKNMTCIIYFLFYCVFIIYMINCSINKFPRTRKIRN